MNFNTTGFKLWYSIDYCKSSLKINQLNQFFEVKVYFFNSIPAKNVSVWVKYFFFFVFHWIWAVAMQSILKFLSSFMIFWPLVTSSDRMSTFFRYLNKWSVSEAEWLAHSVSVPLLRIRQRVRFPCSPDHCRHCRHSRQAHKSHWMFDKLKLNLRLAHF